MATLWGITTFFNPARSIRRLENFRAFRARSHAQGLPLVAVELAFGDAPFELRDSDADLLLRRRTDAVLWQKERLLNLALDALPPTCGAVAWLDADVLFEDDDWAEQAERLLERYVVVQPFSAAIRLPRGGAPRDLPGSEVRRSLREGSETGTWIAPVSETLRRTFPSFAGTTGYAWCARRGALEGLGFFDRCVVGGADRELAAAAFFAPDRIPERYLKIGHPRLRAALARWQARWFERVRGQVGSLPGVLHHLWHGEQSGRAYGDRHEILARWDFDPDADVGVGADGCLGWTTTKAGLVAEVRRYLESRGDDG